MRPVPPVRVRTARLRGGLMGLWDDRTRTVWLDVGLSPAERRCTLAHELVHAERRDVPCGDPVLDSRQELRVERAAAARLVALADLEDALRWTVDPVELAAVLDVDQATLEARLDTLTEPERWRLREAAVRSL